MRRVPVQATVLVVPPQTVVLQNVQHTSHLTEYENTRTLLFEPREQLVQHYQLTTVVNNV